MPKITSRNAFKEYCLRRLGKDVIKINISDQQAEDRIDDALQKFADFHMNGAEVSNVRLPVTRDDIARGYFDLNGFDVSGITQILYPNDINKSNVEVMDDLDYRFMLEYAENPLYGSGGLTHYYINMEYLASMNYLFTPDQMHSFNTATGRLYMHNTVSRAMAGNFAKDFDHADDPWVPLNGSVLTTNDVELADPTLFGHTITDGSGGTAVQGVQFTYETTWYPRSFWSFEISMMGGTYTGDVELVIKDRTGQEIAIETVTLETYWKVFDITGEYTEGNINDITVEIRTPAPMGAGEDFHVNQPLIYKNNFYILQGYIKADPTDHECIWDVAWLKAYCTQLMKLQWGGNLGKFEGVTMAGGVTLNGQQIYDQATTEIERLELELEEKWTEPPEMMWG